MANAFDLIPVVAIGSAGALLTIGAVCWAAGRWKKRSGIAYGLSAFLLYGMLFLSTFQRSVVNANVRESELPDAAVTVLLLGQGVVTALGVGVFTLLLFGLYLAVQAPLDRPVNRLKAYTGCALFCVFVSVFFDPLGANNRLNAAASGEAVQTAVPVPGTVEPTDAEKAEAKAMLDKLLALGVVARIGSDESAVTHFVTRDFQDLSDADMETYTRAALVHHLYVDDGSALRVLIRDHRSGRRVAVREPDGRFKRY
ncbi:MAG: hypothetical protein MJE12_21875 [Alphaproteobacteria bacterium]|nr:hypothetical protein [Alphaproteobacteria bacterium]